MYWLVVQSTHLTDTVSTEPLYKLSKTMTASLIISPHADGLVDQSSPYGGSSSRNSTNYKRKS